MSRFGGVRPRPLRPGADRRNPEPVFGEGPGATIRIGKTMVARDGIGRGQGVDYTQVIDSTNGQKGRNGQKADSIVRLLYGDFFENFFRREMHGAISCSESRSAAD